MHRNAIEIRLQALLIVVQRNGLGFRKLGLNFKRSHLFGHFGIGSRQATEIENKSMGGIRNAVKQTSKW
jgi:hypothetical protein